MADKTKIAEHARLEEAREGKAVWRRWGPYLSERQWGTVREDYSEDGSAWTYFTHDHSRSRAYRWGEDGLAGISDDKQRLCFALALWNGKDAILKERLFGLANAEGNHGEDVKEYYFYLDSTPTHSYMKWLYEYPQCAFPYADLVEMNNKRSVEEPEYELLDTGAFDDDRYFDVQAEYAKGSPEDLLVRITVTNRGPDGAELRLLPTLWFRDTWSRGAAGAKPRLAAAEGGAKKWATIRAEHKELGKRWLYCSAAHEELGERCGAAPELHFTENETNTERLFAKPNGSKYVKDAFHTFVVGRDPAAVNPMHEGTKAAADYALNILPHASVVVRLRLTDAAPETLPDPFAGFEDTFEARLREADEFYEAIIPATVGEDAALVARQAHAGMFWNKQYYLFDVRSWLDEHDAGPFSPHPKTVRNKDWYHMVNDDVISMPDKWEYPWYAAWDLAFHAIALAGADVDFAKQQLELLLQTTYQHPNGQLPAYEWNFGDANPPVHALAVIWLYRMEQSQRGKGDVEFLKRAFAKLLMNFTWWVNRMDRSGRNVFGGGFLGLDNISVFDRSAPLPTGGFLEQADGTAWMAMFCQNMLEIALELAEHEPSYDDLALKFAEHFLWIGAAMNKTGDDGMWDEDDGFYYDVLVRPDGTASRLKIRSMVGLLSLCATTVFEADAVSRAPRAAAALVERLRRNPELGDRIHPFEFGAKPAKNGRTIAALVSEKRLRRILSRMLDEEEFLGDYGLRSLSRYHVGNPFVFTVEGQEYRVRYLPAESDSRIFGGNSNWRGPVWFPVNFMIIRALNQFYLYYGDEFKVECPTHSGNMMNLFEVAQEITTRLQRIFRRAGERRPVFGGSGKFQNDPHWRDHVVFYEYFHGDNGAGIGASHQTGWTGLFSVLQHYGTLSANTVLTDGKKSVFKA